MSDLTLYTNPQSRGQIVRWMLEEIGTPYDTVLLDYGTGMKAESYRAINPMGKVPAIVHKGRIVTECAAICAYLADAFPQAELAPALSDRADYYRWLFFAAGPLEQAITNVFLKVDLKPEQHQMVGYGCLEDVLSTLEQAVAGKTALAAGRFSAADIYVGAQLDFGLQFGTVPSTPAITAYVDGLRARPAYQRARAIDQNLIDRAQKEGAA